MAIIVDKEQKRNDIAMACKELFIQKGINDVTISEVAKTAGVGKGTLYDYFENKEDIVFEIINTLLVSHNEQKHLNLNNQISTKEKIKEYFSFFSNKEDDDLRQLYLHFVSISLNNPSEKMIEFHKYITHYYYNWFVEILQEGINKKEIVPDALKLATGLFTLGEGLFIRNSISNGCYDVKNEINNYLDVLFQLLEVKND